MRFKGVATMRKQAQFRQLRSCLRTVADGHASCSTGPTSRSGCRSIGRGCPTPNEPKLSWPRRLREYDDSVRVAVTAARNVSLREIVVLAHCCRFDVHAIRLVYAQVS